MKRTIYYLFFITLVFNLKNIYADEQTYEKISIENAIQTALNNNQDYRIAVLKQKQAEEKVTAARGQFIPVLETEASATRQNAESGFMSMTDGQYDIRFLQLKYGLNFGAVLNSLRLAKEANKAAVEEVRRVKALAEYSVAKAYFGALLADEIINLRKDSLNALKSNLLDLRNMLKTGSVPKYDVLQAEVKVRSQEVAVLDAESEFRTALDSFNFILGIDSMQYCPDSNVLDKKNFTEPDGSSSRTDALISLALKNRPEIFQLMNKRDMMMYSKKMNDSFYYWPTISVAGSYGMTKYLPNELDVGAPPAMGIDFSGISGTDEWQKTWQVRIGASYRLDTYLPGNKTSAAVREDKLKRMEAEEELNKLKRQIAISIRSNYSALITACQAIISQKQNIESSEEGLRIARESYKAGAVKNSDLLAAELLLTNAKAGYINAVVKYYTSLAELKKEIGAETTGIILEGKNEK